jgi:EAL domain-containing protein (putative c-di-GMP-specific phosphodiesterase class I)
VAVVSAIIALAHSLGMQVVAEGVETESQLAQLKTLACDQVQGFLLAKPLSAEDFESLLRSDGEQSECEHNWCAQEAH